MIDAVGLVHAMILRLQAILLPERTSSSRAAIDRRAAGMGKTPLRCVLHMKIDCLFTKTINHALQCAPGRSPPTRKTPVRVTEYRELMAELEAEILGELQAGGGG